MAKISRKCLIGHECEIRPGARIDHSTIGDKCIIGDDVTIVNSIIMNGATIGKSVSISNSIIGNIFEIEIFPNFYSFFL